MEGNLQFKPGDRLGPFKITAIVGEGGFGIVYKAEQEEPLRRVVALKVLKPGMDSEEVLARFARERQALALMSHPGIAKVHDAGITQAGRPYFVMEFVPGLPVTEFCDRQLLGVRQRIEIFIEICQATQHAHQKAILHRDLKPSNVLVAVVDGVPLPKIIDFGLAKTIGAGGQLDNETFFTEIGRIMGTLDYMSPEQADFSELDIDTRTDIYSLGVMLYELLSGVLPFDRKTLSEAGYSKFLRLKQETDPPKPSSRLLAAGASTAINASRRGASPQALARLLRGDLDWIIFKAMNRDRDCRYATAQELGDDLGRYLKSEPVAARPPSFIYKARKFVKRHRAGASAALAIVLFVSLFLSWSACRDRRSRIQSSEKLRLAAEKSIQQYSESKEDAGKLKERWQVERDGRKRPLWHPVWERQEELDLFDQWWDAVQGIEQEANQAILDLHKALEFAPQGSGEWMEVRQRLAKIYSMRLVDAKENGGVQLPPEYFETMLGNYAPDETRNNGVLALKTDPPGAKVYCFRYQRVEGRQLPLPYHPGSAKEAHGEPFLEVEAIWDEEDNPFLAGDRLQAVNGEKVNTLTGLARVLSKIGEGREVPVQVLRQNGEKAPESWVPFPAWKDQEFKENKVPLKSGRLLSPIEQLAVSFAGYPLAFQDEYCLGLTSAEKSLEAALPRGSYLLVFKKEGYAEARLPVAVPESETRASIRLLKEEVIPKGFIYIPAGSFPCGGDPEASQSLPWSKKYLDSFFISRLEVTLGEWLEFVNDPTVFARIDQNKRKARLYYCVEDLKREGFGDEFIAGLEVQLIPPDPDDESQIAISIDTDKRLWNTIMRLDSPAFFVSQLAAREYAAWRTLKENGRWRYRLPTDYEWEKAARGADRRIFVWGNYCVWSFCWSSPGVEDSFDRVVDMSPLDESVYGVRDMMGSIVEHTTGKTSTHYHLTSCRGGSWYQVDEQFFRICNRNGMSSDKATRDSGFRLVAELK